MGRLIGQAVVALSVATLIAMLLWSRGEVRDLREAVQAISTERAALEAYIAAARQEVQQLRRDIDGLRPPQQPAEVETERSQVAQSPVLAVATNPLVPLERVAVWRSQEFVSDVEEVLALTPEQRASLVEKFKSVAVGNNPPSDEVRQKVVAEVLGEQESERYRAAAEEQVKKERTAAIDKEAILMARKLSLTAAQETNVRAALESIEEQLRPKRDQMRSVMRDAMANHLGGEEAQAALKQQYDELQRLGTEVTETRNSMLFEAVGPMLSDEQKNALLALQAERR